MERKYGKVEKVYFLDNVTDSSEVEEYIADYICNRKKKKQEIEKWGKEALNIDLGKIRFAVYPMKENKAKEEVIVLKTSEEVKYKENKNKRFKSNLCFVIFYSSINRFNFIFEELVDDIMGNTDIYVNL